MSDPPLIPPNEPDPPGSSNWVSSQVDSFFPGVAERFRASADWHKVKYSIEPLFGLFWNLCTNAMFEGQKRIHCQPHTDYKNIVGVCAVVVYQIPGSFCFPTLTGVNTPTASGAEFNHSKRSWLVLWEAGVVVELPPWVVAIYPSSLFYHFNIDVMGKPFSFRESEHTADFGGRARYKICNHRRA